MPKPKGYNVRQITDLNDLTPKEINQVLNQALKHLGFEVWADETPDSTEIILTISAEMRAKKIKDALKG